MKVFCCCCLGVCFVLLVLEFFWFGLVLPCLRTELTTFRGKLGDLFFFFFNFKAPEPPVPRFESQ